VAGVDLQSFYDVVDKREPDKIVRRELHNDAPEDYFLLFCNRKSPHQVQAVTIFHDMLAAFGELSERDQRLLTQPVFNTTGMVRTVMRDEAKPTFAPIVMTEKGPELQTMYTITFNTRSPEPEAQAAFERWRDTGRQVEFSRGVILLPGDMVAVSAKQFAHSVARIKGPPKEEGVEIEPSNEPRWLIRSGGFTRRESQYNLEPEGEFFPDPKGISLDETLQEIKTLDKLVQKKRATLNRE
jgi:hypothetical protein